MSNGKLSLDLCMQQNWSRIKSSHIANCFWSTGSLG